MYKMPALIGCCLRDLRLCQFAIAIGFETMYFYCRNSMEFVANGVRAKQTIPQWIEEIVQ